MGRRRKLPADFDGHWTEEMLSDRQRAILNYIRKSL
ncbi:MAG: repressor LexA, partial [Clostridia bacterium]|nr:repressor LexA [Clostridia bacterium]